MVVSQPVRYRLHGMTLETGWPMVSPLLPAADEADLRFSVVSEAPGKGEWRPEAVIAGPGDSIYLQLGRIGSTEVVRFTDLGDAWLVGEDEIVFHLVRPENDFHVERALLGALLSLWLERREVTALHSAAVAGDGWSIGIMGPNGTGKTSLTHKLLGQGHLLVADDLLVISTSSEKAMAYPSFPQLRLWPDQAVELLGSATGLDKAHPDTEKLRVPLPAAQLASGPTRLVAIYVSRRSGTTTEMGIEPVRGSTALFHLIFNSFVRELLDVPSQRVAWIRRLGALLERVPVFSLPRLEDGPGLAVDPSDVVAHAEGLAAQLRPAG